MMTEKEYMDEMDEYDAEESVFEVMDLDRVVELDEILDTILGDIYYDDGHLAELFDIDDRYQYGFVAGCLSDKTLGFFKEYRQ